MIEIPLFILLLLNQLRWVNYQVKQWQILGDNHAEI